MKLNKLILINGIAGFALVTAIPISVAAQARPNPRSTPPGRIPDSVLEMRERDMNIRRLELERESTEKPKLEASKETIKQVNEDFARIQEINSELIQEYVKGKAPDYKHISESTAELKKRAARLNTNLVLPPDDAVQEATPSRPGKLPTRSPLLDLNDLICSFVTNPIFKNANTIDLTLGARAKRDLANIVNLSDRISRSAEKLSKNVGMSR